MEQLTIRVDCKDVNMMDYDRRMKMALDFMTKSHERSRNRATLFNGADLRYKYGEDLESKLRGIEDVNKLLNIFILYNDIKFRDLTLRCRKQKVVFLRQVFVWIARKHSDISYSDLGRILGRDHSTISHHLKQISNAISINDPLIMGILMPNLNHLLLKGVISSTKHYLDAQYRTYQT